MISIAIDGPAGAGKSTVAKMVAKELGYLYIDTGAMYRALTLKALNNNVAITDETVITKLAENTDITLAPGDPLNVYLDGLNVTSEIRSPAVSKNVSHVAGYQGVRERLVRCQREMAQAHKVVMDGRDVGSYVLPDAEFKFFLNASVNERVARRYNEMRLKGFDVDKEELQSDLVNRDYQDTSRKVSPLSMAKDAIAIDTTNLTPQEVTMQIITIINERSR